MYDRTFDSSFSLALGETSCSIFLLKDNAITLGIIYRLYVERHALQARPRGLSLRNGPKADFTCPCNLYQATCAIEFVQVDRSV